MVSAIESAGRFGPPVIFRPVWPSPTCSYVLVDTSAGEVVSDWCEFSMDVEMVVLRGAISIEVDAADAASCRVSVGDKAVVPSGTVFRVESVNALFEVFLPVVAHVD